MVDLNHKFTKLFQYLLDISKLYELSPNLSAHPFTFTKVNILGTQCSLYYEVQDLPCGFNSIDSRIQLDPIWATVDTPDDDLDDFDQLCVSHNAGCSPLTRKVSSLSAVNSG